MSQQSRRQRLAANFWWIFAVIGAGSFLGPLSGSITNVALPAIAEGYGVDIQSVKWIVLVYLAVNTSLLPIVGKLGQKYGEARVYTIGFAVYCLGSIVCALAVYGDLSTLVAARAFQAAGSALLFAVGSALVTHYVPPERRGLAFGLIGSIVAIALIAGPVLGGLLASYGWQWIFWALVPVTIIGFVACLLLLPIDPGTPTDVPALSSLLWVLVVVGVVLLGEAFSKGLWQQYLPLTIALVMAAIVAFSYSERRGQPLFDYSLFVIPVYRMGALTNILIFIVIFALIIFLPFYLIDYRRLSELQAGMYLAISPLLSVLIGPGSGHLADRVGYRLPVLGGLALNAAGYALMALAIFSHSLPLVAISLGIMGIGGAIFSGPVFAAMMGSVAPQQRAMASSFGSLTRNVGFLAGTSLSAIAFGALLWAHGGRELMLAARSAELARVVPEAAFTFAFGGVLIGCAVLTTLALLLAWKFPNKPPHQ